MNENNEKGEELAAGSGLSARLGIAISAAEMTIIVDTLAGSVDIVDGGLYFRFSGETRNKLVHQLLDRMQQVKIDA